MEVVKRDVDELNELAEKITGTNPRATTTAQALNYIEQNYTGGGSSEKYLFDITRLIDAFYDNELTETLLNMNEDEISEFDALLNAYDNNKNIDIQLQEKSETRDYRYTVTIIGLRDTQFFLSVTTYMPGEYLPVEIGITKDWSSNTNYQMEIVPYYYQPLTD